MKGAPSLIRSLPTRARGGGALPRERFSPLAQSGQLRLDIIRLFFLMLAGPSSNFPMMDWSESLSFSIG